MVERNKQRQKRPKKIRKNKMMTSNGQIEESLDAMTDNNQKTNIRQTKKVRNRKPVPTKNLLVTYSQANKYSKKISSTPKSKWYREDLTLLLGATIKISCDKWKLEVGDEYDKLLLKDITITYAPKNRRVKIFPVIEHMWVSVDRGWKYRNGVVNKLGDIVLNTSKTGFVTNATLQSRGTFYEYKSHTHKNVGYQAYSLKLNKNDEKTTNERNKTICA